MTIPLRSTFDQVPDHYHASRPHYPVQLFERLIKDTKLAPGASILEIGPGTGQATKPLADRGYNITAVELGPQMAEKAREVLAGYSNVQIVTGAFERTELPKDEFALILSATAFHWVLDEYKYTKTHDLLVNGGHLAVIHTVHTCDGNGDQFYHSSKPFFDRYIPFEQQANLYTQSEPPKLASLRSTEKFDPNLFTFVSYSAFPMVIKYTAQQYLDVLSTYSMMIALSKTDRDKFFHRIANIINKLPGGTLEKHYAMTLTIAVSTK